jgi:hypothetical protein
MKKKTVLNQEQNGEILPNSKIKPQNDPNFNFEMVQKLLAEGKISPDEANNLFVSLNTEETEAKKTKKTADVPQKQRAVSALGLKVFSNWNTHFNTFNVPNVDRNDLNNNAQQLSVTLDAVEVTLANKKTNTNELKTINKQINTAVSGLKMQLQLLYPKDQLKAVYANYGLIGSTDVAYCLPTDNTIRQSKLVLLINKLQEANNPITSLPNFNLNQWFNLQNEHNRIWLESENLRQNRSDLGQQVSRLYDLVQADIKRVHTYMKFNFSRQELASRRRLMGFLKESV